MASATAAVAQFSFRNSVIGNGEIAKRVYKLSDFKTVSVSSGIDIYLEPSAKNEAIAVTDKNILDIIEVTQNGDKLTFRLKTGIRKTTKGVKIYLSYKTLEGISASGGSDVYMKDNAVLKSKSLTIDGSGGSDIRLNLDVDMLSCESSGGSDVYLNGTANRASFDCSGGSDVKAKELIVSTCDVESSGGSDVIITATKAITVDASGASDVTFYGNPKDVSISKSGASDVYRK